ncbi:galactosyltransferase-related protein [candidate division CSSED10-310 bacterium]|uniref:Galactosyltransferase-related protein n=1 Tax=candidate division CSSED10-310 bacterium TaxID=2855610 RepID=A0ABV6YXD2_UNCC1
MKGFVALKTYDFLYIIHKDGLDPYWLERFKYSIISVKKQRCPVTICIADTSSTPILSEIQAHLPHHYKYTHHPHPEGKFSRSLTINYGFKQLVEEEYFFLCDIDLVLPTTFTQRCMEYIRADEKFYVEGHTVYVQGEYGADYQELRQRTPYHEYRGGVFLCSSEVFEHLRGFNESMHGWGAEDDEFRFRLNHFPGVEYTYLDDLVSVHLFHPSRQLENESGSCENKTKLYKTMIEKKWIVNDQHWGQMLLRQRKDANQKQETLLPYCAELFKNQAHSSEGWKYKKNFPMVHTQITICSNCQDIEKSIRFIIPDAMQDFTILAEVKYEIYFDGAVYHLLNSEAGRCYHEIDLKHVITSLQRHIHAQAFKEIRNYIHIQGVLGSLGSRNFLIVGEKGSGKTTLALRLLFGGFEIDGAELVLFRDSLAFAFPHRFQMNEESVAVVPEIQRPKHELPYIQDKSGVKIYAFSPAEQGFVWQLKKRAIDVIFYLDINAHPQDHLETYSKHQMLQKLMPETYLADNQHAEKIKNLCQLVENTSCYKLPSKNIKNAVTMIRAICDVLEYDVISVQKDRKKF